MTSLADTLLTALRHDAPFITLPREVVERCVRELQSMSTARIRELEGK